MLRPNRKPPRSNGFFKRDVFGLDGIVYGPELGVRRGPSGPDGQEEEEADDIESGIGPAVPDEEAEPPRRPGVPGRRAAEGESADPDELGRCIPGLPEVGGGELHPPSSGRRAHPPAAVAERDHLVPGFKYHSRRSVRRHVRVLISQDWTLSWPLFGSETHGLRFFLVEIMEKVRGKWVPRLALG